MRTGASLVFDLDVTSRSAFDECFLGQLEDQVSSDSHREMRKQGPTSAPQHGHQRRSAAEHEEGMILDDQWTAKTVIYPLLCSSFGQCIAVTEIIDLNVFDVVTILLVRLVVYGRCGVGGRRLGDWRSSGLESVSDGRIWMGRVDIQSE